MSVMDKRQRESGVVSLLVTLIMMIVITLIVLGFAEIARNEQRSSLDDQLSAQAYYAAESGINDVRTIMNAALAAGGQPQDKTSCDNSGPYVALNSTVDSAHNVSYTCVLIDAAPTTLTYTAGYSSTVVPLISSGAAFGNLDITWKAAAGLSSSVAGCTLLPGNNPPASGVGQWACNYPVLRLDILNANGALTRANWNAATSTVFLVPYNAGAASSVALGAHGTAVRSLCSAAAGCSVTITGLVGTKYYMRMTTLYHENSDVNISAGGLRFTGAQAVVDATGKAQDVLRRVLVAVDLTDANVHHIPSAAIVSRDTVCKRFAITNGSLNVYDDMSAGGGGNTLCNLHNDNFPGPQP